MNGFSSNNNKNNNATATIARNASIAKILDDPDLARAAAVSLAKAKINENKSSLISSLNNDNDKKRRYRSWVWMYFIPTDRKTATCSICNKVIVHGHPTSHLINHLTKGTILSYK